MRQPFKRNEPLHHPLDSSRSANKQYRNSTGSIIKHNTQRDFSTLTLTMLPYRPYLVITQSLSLVFIRFRFEAEIGRFKVIRERGRGRGGAIRKLAERNYAEDIGRRTWRSNIELPGTFQLKCKFSPSRNSRTDYAPPSRGPSIFLIDSPRELITRTLFVN